MTAAKLRNILLVALGGCAVVFILAATFGLSVLGTQSKKMTELKLQNKILDLQLTNLAQSKKDVQQYAYFKDIAKTVIPADKDQAQTVLEIFKIAEQAGISLQSVTFPSSTLGARTPTSASSAPTKTLISQAQPVSGIAGLYSIELTITPQSGPQVPADKQVTYPKMLDFLRRVEDNRRTAQITQVNIQPVGTSGVAVNFSLNINMFIKP